MKSFQQKQQLGVDPSLSLSVNFDNFSEFENSHKRWSPCQHSVDNNFGFSSRKSLKFNVSHTLVHGLAVHEEEGAS